MPWSYRIDKELKIVFSKGIGIATDDDIRGHREALLNDPDFDSTYNQLVDFSEVTKFELSLATMEAIAKSKFFSETSMRAIVAPQDLAFASARVFEAYYPSDDKVMVFRELDEARRWLNLD